MPPFISGKTFTPPTLQFIAIINNDKGTKTNKKDLSCDEIKVSISKLMIVSFPHINHIYSTLFHYMFFFHLLWFHMPQLLRDIT